MLVRATVAHFLSDGYQLSTALGPEPRSRGRWRFMSVGDDS
jgi:hypothetical protein